jgi:hypothetical protein
LTDVCGLRPVSLKLAEPVGEASEAELEDVEDALDSVCWWWMERMEETEDEVDLRPRSPELRR